MMSAGVRSVDPSAAEGTPEGVALLFSFPGGRYHATPWDHHVNEGLIEWPPSPWRLLRGFLATGYTKLRWPNDGPPPVARSLFEKLTEKLPTYSLPSAVGTHSRHYMPTARFKDGRTKEETTLVLDTWAQINDGVLGVHWNVALTPAERLVLADLVRELGYIGRSESWVEGILLDDANTMRFDVRPGEARDRPGTGWEQVSVLAPLSAPEYLAWREKAVRDAITSLPTVDAKGKPLKLSRQNSQRHEVQSSYPADLVACLQIDTAWLQALGWSQPPGTRKVFYWRRTDAFEPGAARAGRQRAEPASVELMLLSMATASGNTHALPSIVRTLPQGELLHQALLAQTGSRHAPPSVLSGRDEHGRPLKDEHRHAHLLHLDLDGDGHLDHALIWAPMGLDARAQQVARAVRRTFAKGVDPLRVALAAAGSRTDLLRLPGALGDRLRYVLGDADGLRCWRSLTPFVPPRFLKARGKNSLEGQVAAELAARGLPEPLDIRPLDGDNDDDLIRRSRHFIRRRAQSKAPSPPLDCGFMLEVTFKEAIAGPLVLGYGSHFGLGLFTARVE